MKIAGSGRRMWIGAWMLAALLLGALNAYWLMVLEQQPLIGHSQTIRKLQTELVQFENMMAGGVLSSNSGGDLQALFEAPPAAGSIENKSTEQPAGTGMQPLASDPAPLPALTGILQVIGLHGAVRFHAVLNGRVCGEKDLIDKYTVEQIKPTGVVLRRAGGKYFIKSPSPFYSNDQGE